MVGSHCRRFALAFGLLGILLTGSAGAAQTGTITGRVTDAEGQPLASAQALAVASGGAIVASTTTGADGRYRLSVAPATYMLVVRLIPFADARRPGIVVLDGATVEVDVGLSRVLETVVVTGSRGPERLIETPVAIVVVPGSRIQERPTTNVIDQILPVPGIDVSQTSLISRNVVARGFNNVFSGAMLMITDYRYATVPSLRVNTSYLIPTPNEDVDQIEVLLGPGSALYGPNAANGVVHILSRSPFDYQGTTVSIGGGNRSILRGAIRHSDSVSSRFGYKISGQILRGDDWQFTDPVEDSLRRRAILGGADPDTLLIGRRDFDVERWTGEGRFDIRPTDSSLLIIGGGRAFAGTALEMTGIGTAQAKDWSYDYLQTRWSWKRLFAQAFINTSDTKDTYLLRTGQPVSDNSRVIAAQLQHAITFRDWQTVTYGLDYQKTDPRTNGTINGRNENIDEITEVGGYLQSETSLSKAVELDVALRMDDHSELEDPVFSPRAALVFTPDDFQSIRLTYNRAFSTPTTNNLFLDLVAGRIPAGSNTLHEIRTLGVPASGLRFQRNCAGGVGTLCMRQSPLLATLFPGGPTASEVIAADATRTWRGVIEFLIAQGQPASLRNIPQPSAAQVQSILAQLNLTTFGFQPVSANQVRDVDPLRPTITNTYEVGYKIERPRLRFATNVYYEKKNDFVGPLVVETPNVFYERTSLQAYLTPFVGAGTAAALATAISRIPVGTVTPTNSPLTSDSDLILTYRNFGDLDRWGAELVFEGHLTNTWSVNGSYSRVNRNLWTRDELGGISDVALNAPKNKATLGIAYRQVPHGLTVDVRGKWNDEFPMNSGAFLGHVDAYTTVDLTLAYRVSFAKNTIMSVNVQNLFDDRHNEFVGAPEIGRLIMSQVQVTF